MVLFLFETAVLLGRSFRIKTLERLERSEHRRFPIESCVLFRKSLIRWVFLLRAQPYSWSSATELTACQAFFLNNTSYFTCLPWSFSFRVCTPSRMLSELSFTCLSSLFVNFSRLVFAARCNLFCPQTFAWARSHLLSPTCLVGIPGAASRLVWWRFYLMNLLLSVAAASCCPCLRLAAALHRMLSWPN